VVVAGFAAQVVNKFREAAWFVPSGQYAAAAAIGLLGVTLIALARPIVDIHPMLLLGAAAAFAADCVDCIRSC